MKRNKYVRPEISVHDLEVQQMISLSLTGGPASSEYDALVNEREDDFSDIWGNEY